MRNEWTRSDEIEPEPDPHGTEWNFLYWLAFLGATVAGASHALWGIV